jgi:tRNA (guanine-N7-)-methyltransferase
VTDPIPSSAPAASFILRLQSILDPLFLDPLFPCPQPLEVELGSGDGSFLVQYAASQPDRNFLGVERLLGRLRKIQRKASRHNLVNLRLLRIEAGYFLEYLLPHRSVSSLHIYFPDPWPKRKQQKHRLINDRFPGLAARVLLPGGTVHLRTDDRDYFSQMSTVFAKHPDFALVETPERLAALRTDFEIDFLAQGISTLRASYQRRGLDAASTAPHLPPPQLPAL